MGSPHYIQGGSASDLSVTDECRGPSGDTGQANTAIRSSSELSAPLCPGLQSRRFNPALRVRVHAEPCNLFQDILPLGAVWQGVGIGLTLLYQLLNLVGVQVDGLR